jgi:low temperature requirement protein LtrA/transcriptional regulator with XRE-family HTH domain
MDPKSDVREFLASRRARITPAQAGLPAYGGNRRVKGLRREEVAMLAGISAEYYVRLERGNLRGVSEEVLDGIARALQLDEGDRMHLFDLARSLQATPGGRSGGRPGQEHVRPAVQRILDSLVGVPAFVQNARLDVLAANQLGEAFYGPQYADPARPVNGARFVFLNPKAKDYFLDWPTVANDAVGILRSEAGRDPYDKRLTDLIGELSTRSEDFRTLWAAHPVKLHRTGVKRLHHPIVGDLTLDFEMLDLPADSGQKMLLYCAEPASPSRERLDLLASWATTPTDGRAAALDATLELVDPKADPPRLRTVELRNRETVKPLELFFDLVFVLGFTQCTALMTAQPTWAGMGRGMLVLAVIWWAWVCYAWLTNLIEPEEGAVRLAMFAAMVGLLVVALCTPRAFGDQALPFAVALAIVRLGHLVLYAIAARDRAGLRHWLLGYAAVTAVVVSLLVAASYAHGAAQAGLWLLAIAVDWGLPAVSGVEHWQLVPAHFAERHNLVIILALGETVVALGAGPTIDLTAPVLVAAALGVGLAATFWWIYFDVVAIVTERRLTQTSAGRERNTLARDSYSYLHFPMVAGIVLSALAVHETLAHVDQPLDDVHAFALLGGSSLYLLAHVVLRLRNAHTISPTRLGAAITLLALIPLALHVDALVALAAVTVLLWAMVGYETFFVYDDRRYRLRHGLDIEVPGSG